MCKVCMHLTRMVAVSRGGIAAWHLQVQKIKNSCTQQPIKMQGNPPCPRLPTWPRKSLWRLHTFKLSVGILEWYLWHRVITIDSIINKPSASSVKAEAALSAFACFEWLLQPFTKFYQLCAWTVLLTDPLQDLCVQLYMQRWCLKSRNTD